MKLIACLAAAALAASMGLGCRGEGQPKSSTSDLPMSPSPSPSPAASGPAAPAAPAAPSPPPSPAYTGDIEKLCDVVRLSGVGSDRTDDRLLPIANWLAANLTTAESRRFLAQIQPLAPAGKADALDAEARRVGLRGCNLAAEWRSPPTP